MYGLRIAALSWEVQYTKVLNLMNFKSGDNFQNYAGHCSPGSSLKEGDNTGRCYDKNGNVVAKQYNAENDGKKNAKLFPNNKEAQDRVSVGNGKQETFRNLWVQSTEYSHIIQHSAGSLNDANALKALAENYQCTDTCTTHNLLACECLHQPRHPLWTVPSVPEPPSVAITPGEELACVSPRQGVIATW